MTVLPLKRGPRGGFRPSGQCECDSPHLDSVKAVRAWMKSEFRCDYCGDRGCKPVEFCGSRYHVRCIIRARGLSVLVASGAWREAGLCCLGDRRMKRLLALVEQTGGFSADP